MSEIPPAGAGLAGLSVAVLFAMLPDWRLESLVGLTGVGEVLSVARPPLGWTARSLLGLTLGTATGAVTWAGLYLLFGHGGVFAREGGRNGMPVVRSADLHPDAPHPRPLSAAELPTPAPPVEQDLPRDLDQPIAPFDPHAVPASPREPVRPVAPLKVKAEPLGPGERIDSVVLPARQPADAGEETIEALLDRLERGARRRART